MSTSDNSLELANKTQRLIQGDEKLDLESPAKILSFGQDATKGISQFSDELLNQFSLSIVDESAKLLTNLNKLMERFDNGDFKAEEPKGFLGKLFKKAKDAADDLYNKYTVFSKEIDKIFIEIKKFELEIQDTNQNMDVMYQKNMDFYASLDNYINQARTYLNEQIKNQIQILQDQHSVNDQDGLAQIELGRMMELEDALEQRIYDLEFAKAVSLQTAPQIKLIQKGNYNLLRKINSAFVITMPLFRQGIIQAITLKRQKMHMDSMAALDESTNRLLKQNARNVVENAKMSTLLNQNSSVRIETIEESYHTIINGIKEVDEIQKQNQSQREQSLQKLERLKAGLITGKPIQEMEEHSNEQEVSNQSQQGRAASIGIIEK